MLLQPSAPIVTTTDQEPVTSLVQLVRYFEQQTKPRTAWRVGLEHEKIAVRHDGRPVPFDTDTGLWAMLGRLERVGFAAEMEGDHAVALWRDDDKVSL